MKINFNLKEIIHLPGQRAKNEVWANPLRDWMILFVLSLLALVAVFIYAMYRFYVWQNVEDYLPKAKSNDVQYNTTAAQKIQEDFLRRRQEAQQISQTAVPLNQAVTNDDTDSESTTLDNVANIRSE